MKIAHEAPNSIFGEVQKLTDYDYCLVHLLEESEEYRSHFFMSKLNGREVLLDNSIFELGEAFDSDKFAYWVQELRPDWYIVPDSLENCRKTLSNYHDFIKKYPDLPGKRIGVLQGKTYEELSLCYRSLLQLGVDKIAISFDYSYYNHKLFDKLKGWMTGRQAFITRLSNEEFFDENTPIHLLGCSLPQEFSYYRDMKFIESVDTSNPVVHGLKAILYKDNGLTDKVSQKLFTLINSEVTRDQLEIVKFNIESFKKIVK